MAEHSRYSVSDEGADLENGVLKNALGITVQSDLDDVETLLFSDAYEHFFDYVAKGKINFGIAFLFELHRFVFEWLYPWGGKLRTINMSKNGMQFALVNHLEKSLKSFGKMMVVQAPLVGDTKHVIARKLTTIHSEYNAIHPFREGNGRTIRLYLDLLAASIGYNPIDWGERDPYIASCIKGMAGNDEDMVKIISEGLTKI